MSTPRQLSGDYYSQFTSTIQIPNLTEEPESVLGLSLRAGKSQPAGHFLMTLRDLQGSKLKKIHMHPIRKDPFSLLGYFPGLAE
ncbi:hypothetical protein MDA_GLEAN10018832 [Myotis davidii]|uniref:Uncharacterized protein n=1 Tax=Myotis davidii TaxID=225400 RepID=L5M948_MYODS|nr:hypothetical protein MDA_GLEAN10018832 [Myotis davidii]